MYNCKSVLQAAYTPCKNTPPSCALFPPGPPQLQKRLFFFCPLFCTNFHGLLFPSPFTNVAAFFIPPFTNTAWYVHPSSCTNVPQIFVPVPFTNMVQIFYSSFI